MGRRTQPCGTLVFVKILAEVLFFKVNLIMSFVLLCFFLVCNVDYLKIPLCHVFLIFGIKILYSDYKSVKNGESPCKTFLCHNLWVAHSVG